MPNFQVLGYDDLPSDLKFNVYLTKLEPKEINYSLDFENFKNVSNSFQSEYDKIKIDFNGVLSQIKDIKNGL